MAVRAKGGACEFFILLPTGGGTPLAVSRCSEASLSIREGCLRALPGVHTLLADSRLLQIALGDVANKERAKPDSGPLAQVGILNALTYAFAINDLAPISR